MTTFSILGEQLFRANLMIYFGRKKNLEKKNLNGGENQDGRQAYIFHS
jgi:hypothetical protein